MGYGIHFDGNVDLESVGPATLQGAKVLTKAAGTGKEINNSIGIPHERHLGRIALKGEVQICGAECWPQSTPFGVTNPIAIASRGTEINAEGPDGLKDRPRSGRSSKLDASQKAEVRHWLEDGPGPSVPAWTLGLLKERIKVVFGAVMSLETVRYLVRALGFRKDPRTLLSRIGMT